MKKKTMLFLGAVAGAGFLAFNWLSKAIEFNFRGIRFKSGNLSGLKLGLRFMLHNTKNVPITLDSFKGKIWWGKEYELADLNIPEPIRLEAGEREEMELLFTVKSVKVISEILALIADKDYSLKKFIVRGTLKITPIGGVTLTIPINEPISLAE